MKEKEDKKIHELENLELNEIPIVTGNITDQTLVKNLKIEDINQSQKSQYNMISRIFCFFKYPNDNSPEREYFTLFDPNNKNFSINLGQSLFLPLEVFYQF